MRIVGMLRVRNEARWLGRVLKSIAPLCEKVVVFDDHSTDGSTWIAREAGAIVFDSPYEGLNETRDKNALLEIVGGLLPDWVLCIDGDEELEASGAEILPHLATNAAAAAYSLRVAYLWDRPDQVRVDGIYGSFRRPSFFRLAPGAAFVSRSAKGFHCSNAPQGLKGFHGLHTNVTLLHYGYMERETRLRKYLWYNEQDPNNTFEDGYRHMVAGDLPAVPADVKTRHAGPLKLIPLSDFLS
jgi:glycosyltransferase involved in cell wall biosynthesis